MYTVYVLQDSEGKFYKGFTKDLAKRFSAHTSGSGSRTTSMMKNLKIVYTEQFEKLEDARAREVYFKSAAGRKFLKDKLRS
jgi:putative endonuclease